MTDDFDPFGLKKESSIHDLSQNTDVNDSAVNWSTDFPIDFSFQDNYFASFDSSTNKKGSLSNVSGAFETSFDNLNLNADLSEPPLHVHVALHEEISCIYNGSLEASEMSIRGTISVNPPIELDCKPFYLVIKDYNSYLENVTSYFECASKVITSDFTKQYKRYDGKGTHVFRVSIPHMEDIHSESIDVIKYTCAEKLKPLPLLVRTKVRIAGKYCRVALVIRTNPSNKQDMKNIVVMLAVPPDVDGDTIRMSRKGGVWDAMKKIVTWVFDDQLDTSGGIDMQLQFELVASSYGIGIESEHLVTPKFPVMVRCDAFDDHLSGIDIELQPIEDGIDGIQKLFKPKVDRSYRLLHRKLS